MVRFHSYSFQNKLYLSLQGATGQVASFAKWKELGRYVKAGERAMEVLAPLTKKRTVTKTDDEGNEEAVEKTTVSGYRFVPVFDITQTDGKEIESLKMTIDAGSMTMEKLLSVAVALGYTVQKAPLELSKGGHIIEREITLNSSKTQAENIGTLIHELAHGELGHTNENDTSAQDAKEQEAEALTALICQEYGIDRKSVFYLKSWGTQNIIEALPKISKAYANLKKALA